MPLRRCAVLAFLVATAAVTWGAPTIEYHPLLGVASPNPGLAGVPVGPVAGPRAPGLSVGFEGMTFKCSWWGQGLFYRKRLRLVRLLQRAVRFVYY